MGKIILVLIFVAAVITGPVAFDVEEKYIDEIRKSVDNLPSRWGEGDPCIWEGITCSKARIIAIDLPEQFLIGKLPKQIYAPNLLRVNLSNNGLQGQLPVFGAKSKIETLDFYNNVFNSMPEDFFVNLNHLKAINISDNPFEEWSLPENITNISSLEEISARNTNLTGKLPENMTNFRKLKTIDVSCTPMSSLSPLPSTMPMPAFSPALLQKPEIYMNNSDCRKLQSPSEVFTDQDKLFHLIWAIVVAIAFVFFTGYSCIRSRILAKREEEEECHQPLIRGQFYSK